MTVQLPDLAAMEALGRKIAGKIEPGDVVALSGTLGTGKTTLARAIIAALAMKAKCRHPLTPSSKPMMDCASLSFMPISTD